MGYVIADKHVPLSVRSQQLVTIQYPEADASLCYVKLAKKILDSKPTDAIDGNIGFFWNNVLENAIS